MTYRPTFTAGRHLHGGARLASLAVGLCLSVAVADGSPEGVDGRGRTASSATEAVLRADNYRDVVAHVLRWYTGIGYAAALFETLSPPADARRIYSGEALRDDGLHALSEYLCRGDGWAHFDLIGHPSGADTVILDGCALARDTRSGTTSRQDAPFGPAPLGRRYAFDGYRIDDGAGLELEASGVVWRDRAATPLGTTLSSEHTLERYRAANGDGETLLESVDTRVAWSGASGASSRDLVTLRGGFRLRSPLTGGALLQVETPVPFSRTDDASAFTDGSLRLAADDGSAVLLETRADAPGALRVTLSRDGVDTLVDPSWETWDATLEYP